MEENVPINQVILHKWLKAGYIYKRSFYPTEEGSPQGSIISPVLANWTLDGLESLLEQHLPKSSPKGRQAKVNLIRFADDFIVTGSSKQLLEEQIQPLLQTFLKERGLEFSPEKTHITHIKEGFDFLGHNIRKYGDKLLIKPAKKSLKKHLAKLREVIKTNKQISAGKLILKLNPQILGWANYYRHVVSSKTFSQVDFALFRALWQWARRRHRNKGKWWVKEKYFPAAETRKWVFTGTIIGKQGESRTIRLWKSTDVAIQRHLKIQGKANPYDREWETYFEHRLDLKTVSQLKGKRKLLYLWKEQKGVCPVCEQKITKLSGWHSHHLVWKVHGGGDGMANRVLLHPNCHRQVHSRPDLSLRFVKPRSDTNGQSVTKA